MFGALNLYLEPVTEHIEYHCEIHIKLSTYNSLTFLLHVTR